MAAGAVAILVKPFDADALVDAVAAALRSPWPRPGSGHALCGHGDAASAGRGRLAETSSAAIAVFYL